MSCQGNLYFPCRCAPEGRESWTAQDVWKREREADVMLSNCYTLSLCHQTLIILCYAITIHYYIRYRPVIVARGGVLGGVTHT